MKEISVAELSNKKENHEDFLLIDVREAYEYESANLGGLLIPLGSIEESVALIPRDKPVIVHCRSGMRSASAIHFLESKFGYTNLFNLKGGILAYAREIDPSLRIA